MDKSKRQQTKWTISPRTAKSRGPAFFYRFQTPETATIGNSKCAQMSVWEIVIRFGKG